MSRRRPISAFTPGTWEELLERVARRLRITRKDARAFAVEFLHQVQDSTEVHGRCAIPGFGVFRVGTHKGRRILTPPGIRGPAGTLELPRSRKIKFRPSKEWKP